ncbi:MAG: YfhO family protein, partial [Acidobacteria bacterium]|nr:YfhO family protein [Acidobacteriota bacterium]
LAPVFTYAFAREVGRSRLASLLAGLSFTYGGLMLSGIGINGMLSNAVMWLPLVLIGIERARTRPFIPSLLLATAGYLMSVLTGIGQGFVYVGGLALAYAVFAVLFPRKSWEAASWTDWRRWKPLAVIIGAVALAAGVAAFQILETLQAAKSSVRGVLSYEQFSDGSFLFSMALDSWLQPIYPHADVTLNIAPLAVGLALAAVGLSVRHPLREPSIWFWLVIAVMAWLLIMGKYTPLNNLFYHIPFLNRFRVPCRHSFELTFSIAILGAYGWDLIASSIAGWKQSISAWSQRVGTAVGILCLLLVAAVGAWWWSIFRNSELDPHISPKVLNYDYLGWKAAFTFLVFVALWRASRLSSDRWRLGLLGILIAFACFFEPFIMITRWNSFSFVPAGRFSASAPTTLLLKQYQPEQNRVYTQINPFAESQSAHPTHESGNLTALARLHNVSGYDPLIQERYSRALNDSSWENFNRDPYLQENPELFEQNSSVLDLLNTSFVVSLSNPNNETVQLVNKHGIAFAVNDILADIKSYCPTSMTGLKAEGDTLALVTTLGNSGDIANGEIVGKILVHTEDGRTIERQLKAGIDTAELAHERPDVRPRIRHDLAPVFDSYSGDDENENYTFRYLARINLGERVRIKHVDLIKAPINAGLGLWKASVYDSASRRSIPLFRQISEKNWETIFRNDRVLIRRNLRPLPRAWLVTDAVAVSKFEAWATIRGQSNLPFDPRRTA